MKPIANWENVKAAGNIEILPAGGYVCEIKNAVEKQNRMNSGTHLEISFDVCEGEWRDFFSQDYRNQNREDKFWRGIIRQNIPQEGSGKFDMQASFFRRFTNTLEESNPGYHWDWNEAELKGKKIGVVFGERERQSQKGTVYVVTDAVEVITVDDARSGKYKVPEKKTLAPAATSYGGFSPVSSSDDDDLPF